MKNLRRKYDLSEIDYLSQDNSKIISNSEIMHSHCFIENPINNELRKTISLKLGPYAEHEFIVVM